MKDEAGALIARLEDLAARRQALVLRLEAVGLEWLRALRYAAAGPHTDQQAQRLALARTRSALSVALAETAAAQECLLEELDALVVTPGRAGQAPVAAPYAWASA